MTPPARQSSTKQRRPHTAYRTVGRPFLHVTALGDYHTAQMRLAAALQIDPRNDRALRLQRQALNQEGANH